MEMKSDYLEIDSHFILKVEYVCQMLAKKVQ